MADSKIRMQTALEDIVEIMRRGNWPDALLKWGGIATQYPDLAGAYLSVARELRDLGKSEDAERVFGEMLERFPANVEAAVDYAMMAYARREWLEAIRRFEMVRTRFPEALEGHRFCADLWCGQKQFENADTVLRDAMARFPAEPRLAISYAWSAHLRGDQIGDWREASQRWRWLTSHFPDEPLGYAMAGFVLTRYLGLIDEAEEVLLKGMERFPHDTAIASNYARAADYRQDWREAMRRWDALVGRWPNDRTILNGRGETEDRRRLIEIDSPRTAMSSHAVDTSASPKSQTISEEGKLLIQFESLGENCEFGLAQRHFGVEPLGLLRWVSLEPEGLCRALEERFCILDDPEDLEIKLIGPEYHAFGERYQMRMHTFIVASEYKGSVEQLKAQLFRRLRYLKDKLLGDLTAAEKIFVWQSGVGSFLNDDTAFRMHRAVQRYSSNNTLLVVRRNNERTKAPALSRRSAGLIVATLPQVEKIVGSDGSVSECSPFNGWLMLCRNALASRTATRTSERDT
jgi:tetratricopeptide (TPR) repeat protein